MLGIVPWTRGVQACLNNVWCFENILHWPRTVFTHCVIYVFLHLESYLRCMCFKDSKVFIYDQIFYCFYRTKLTKRGTSFKAVNRSLNQDAKSEGPLSALAFCSPELCSEAGRVSGAVLSAQVRPFRMHSISAKSKSKHQWMCPKPIVHIRCFVSLSNTRLL